jgi:hypothetical protein
LDTSRKIFGAFTPVAWELDGNGKDKSDPSQKSFLSTLKNPHNVPARTFALKAEKKQLMICCYSHGGPHFWVIAVWDNCNGNADSCGYFGSTYNNDAGLDGKRTFAGSPFFPVKAVDVFEINPAPPSAAEEKSTPSSAP